MNKIHYIFIFYIALFIITPNAYALDVNKEIIYRVVFGSSEDVKYLLEEGANANQVDSIGTPLVSLAASREDGQDIPMLKVLIYHGANVNAGGPNRLYPVLIAARGGREDLMQYLLEINAKLNIHDNDGYFPMDLAENNDHMGIIKIIKDIAIEKKEKEKERISPEKRIKLIKGILSDRCFHEYNSLLIKLRMKDSQGMVQMDLKEYNDKIYQNSVELYRTFKVGKKSIRGMQVDIVKALREELIVMVSNRNRKKKGVGSKGDMERRCNPKVAKWMKNHTF